MTATYTVREPGMTCWSEGLTLAQAYWELIRARSAGLSRAVILDEDGVRVDDFDAECAYRGW